MTANAELQAKRPKGHEHLFFLFLSEQQAATIGQLAAYFGIYPSDIRRFVAEFEDRDLVESKRFLTGGEEWVWLTPAGARMAGTGFKAIPPHYRGLTHLGAINDARLYFEARFEGIKWVCERQLRRDEGGSPKGYIPDGVVVHTVTAPDGTKSELRYAIEAELSPKEPAELDDKIWVNEKKHDLVVYFATPAICQNLKALGEASRHPKLRLQEIPAINRRLDQSVWRVPGDPGPRPRGLRVDYDAIELSELELDLLDLILEQGKMPTDQICAFFDLEPEEADYVLERMVQQRVLARAKPLVDEPSWHWVTAIGAVFSETGLKSAPPSLNGLERARVLNEVRLRLTKEDPDIEWVSGRVLWQAHRSRNLPPDGALKFEDRIHAVDVLLFVGQRSLENRMARRFEEGYDAMLWLYSKKSSSAVKRFWKDLPEKYQKRVRLLPIPAAPHLLLAPDPSPRRRSNAMASVPYSHPSLWVRLAEQGPARLRRIRPEDVKPEALKRIAEAAGVDRQPVMIEAWTQLESNGVRWILTDLGFFRVVHSGAGGTKADEVVSDDLFVKEEGPPVKLSPQMERGAGARGSSAPRRITPLKKPPQPERHEMDDRVWELVKPLIPPVQIEPGIHKLPVADRAILSGLIWRLRKGVGWTSSPYNLGYGSSPRIQARLRRWEALGVWDPVRELLEAELPDGEELEWWRLEPLETMRERGRPSPTTWPRVKDPKSSDGLERYAHARVEPQSYEVDDPLWELLEEALAAVEEERKPAAHRIKVSDRMALSGAVWRLRKGVAWKEIPFSLGYGSWKAIRERLRELEDLGIWDNVREILEAELPDGKRLAWWQLGPMSSRLSERPAADRRRALRLSRRLRNRPDAKPKVPMVKPQKFEMSDAVWRKLAPLLGAVRAAQEDVSGFWVTDRAAISGILWRLRHDVGWDHVPSSLGYGYGDSIRQRLRELEDLGVWADVREILEADLPDGRDLPWDRIKRSRVLERDRFNYRQRAWIERMQEEPGMEFSYADYMRFTGVGKQAARDDLLALAEDWLVIGTRDGSSEFTFAAARDLPARLQGMENN